MKTRPRSEATQKIEGIDDADHRDAPALPNRLSADFGPSIETCPQALPWFYCRTLRFILALDDVQERQSRNRHLSAVFCRFKINYSCALLAEFTTILYCERPCTMLASLALLALLQPQIAGADALSLANTRITYGVLGPPRTDTNIHPGDSLVLSFDIQGISADDSGRATYSTVVEVTDASGKSLFKQPAKKFQEFLALGGATLPAFAQVDLGLDSPAGKYSMAVTVTDNATQKSAVAKQEFTVGKKGFSLIRLNATGDADGLVPLGALAVGQPFFIHAAVAGFGVEPAAKQPKIAVMLRVLDENNKPLVAKPFTGSIDKDVPANATSLPIRFYLPLNRPGNYRIELTATDAVHSGSAKLTYPITVHPPK
jgi:hypothetical protein